VSVVEAGREDVTPISLAQRLFQGGEIGPNDVAERRDVRLRD
jgi:hypothetical protein